MAIGENRFPKIKIVGGPHGMNCRIYLDDVDISHYCRGVEFGVDVDSVLTATLHLAVLEVELEGEGAVAIKDAVRKTENGMRETTGFGHVMRQYRRATNAELSEVVEQAVERGLSHGLSRAM